MEGKWFNYCIAVAIDGLIEAPFRNVEGKLLYCCIEVAIGGLMEAPFRFDLMSLKFDFASFNGKELGKLALD